MKSGKWKRITLCTLITVLFFSLLSVQPLQIVQAETSRTVESAETLTARPSSEGALHVEGQTLVSADGSPVQLHGVSTHGLQWYGQFVNKDLFSYISSDWNCNLIRLAMYSDYYCQGHQEEMIEQVEKGIEYAVSADMYVIVDWHILSDGNPNEHTQEARSFFAQIAAKYAGLPNVIYEICNEPGENVTWEQIRNYAEQLIPVIRKQNENAVILVGTPDSDSNLSAVLEDPLQEYSNLLYTYHFYAASHGESSRTELQKAVEAGLPVFVSECGYVNADGNGTADYEESAQWFDFLQEKQISYAVWSLSNKEETSAMIKSSCSRTGSLKESDLTSSGQYTMYLLQGRNPDEIASMLASTTLQDLWQDHTGLEWLILGSASALFLALVFLIHHLRHAKGKAHNVSYNELLRLTGDPGEEKNLSASALRKKKIQNTGKLFLILSTYTSLIYLCWRILFSIPFTYGWFPIACNILLLAVELLGFAESLIHYSSMMGLRDYPLPEIEDSQWPDVDIFIATYNEPEELLRKTVNGCKHMLYPDPQKVHIYVCDDKRRPEIRAFAAKMGVNYFDRPDNQGAKAGNLNHAMGLTASPYVVTFDADMIPREEFLLQTIPYFVDAEKRNAQLPEEKRMPLGLLQTPQCFYNPDVFQHNLYAEKRIPNEQDFFYRKIEPAKTTTNSVIYGGSNTILSRQALNDIGGFYTGSITEDFATGMLIESAGYISLGLGEPLASGQAPITFKDHIKQRTRWGRGVIVTARKLKLMTRKGLTMDQRLSYMSSVIYWYSSMKNLIYLTSPLLFGVFAVPVFRCSWQDILVFWLPMFLCQNLCLRMISAGSLSPKWSGIQETSVMPFLFLPILQESVGISLTTFKVTDKSAKAPARKRQSSFKWMLPFLILILLSLYAIIRVCIVMVSCRIAGLLAVLFWLVRNLYYLFMSLFLIDGRDEDGENVIVKDAEMITLIRENGENLSGITTQFTEHSINVFFDELELFRLGEPVTLKLEDDHGMTMNISGSVVRVRRSPDPEVPSVYTIEILDFHDQQDDYIYSLYNRIPTLPQTFQLDVGLLRDLWTNLTRHAASHIAED